MKHDNIIETNINDFLQGKQTDEIEGFNYGKRGAESVNEYYWLEKIAETEEFIYDPLMDVYFKFNGKIWENKSKKQIVELINKFIRNNAAESEILPLGKILSGRALEAIASRMQGHDLIVKPDAFENVPRGIIYVKNGRVKIEKDGGITFTSEGFRKEDMRRKILDINYNGVAVAEKTLRWLNRIFQNREDDVLAIAKLLGTAVYGSNEYKKLVVIHGDADLGKSRIPELCSKLIGYENATQLDTNRLGERFEMRRFVGKSFLYAQDVDKDFMTRIYSDRLKQITGYDRIRVEGKNSHEEFSLRGDKTVCFTSNFNLLVKSDVDKKAWQTRLVYLHANGQPYEGSEADCNFLNSFFEDDIEASGILNFALHGITTLLTEGEWSRSEEQLNRIKDVLKSSDTIEEWIGLFLQVGDNPTLEEQGITSQEAWSSYVRWTDENRRNCWPENEFKKQVATLIEDKLNIRKSHSIQRGRNVANGWRGLHIKEQQQTQE